MSTQTIEVTSDLSEIEAVPAVTPEPAVRQLPWAGITTGKANQDSLTSAEMLQRAGLDWEVGIRPLKRQLSNGTLVDSSRFETYRLDNEEIAARLDTNRVVVSKWRRFFFEEGQAGLGVVGPGSFPLRTPVPRS